MKRTAGIALQTRDIVVNKVFSFALNQSKIWYALNTELCCSKPVNFCSFVSKVFHEEYHHVVFEDLRDENGVIPPFKWFNAHHRPEKVYVASAFGLLVGLLRLKKLEDCAFLRTEEFACIKDAINARGLDSQPNIDLFKSYSSATSEASTHNLTARVKALEGQLTSAAEEIVSLRAKLQRLTPNLPANESPPKRKHNTTIAELETADLSPATKKKKIKQKYTEIMEDLDEVLLSHGESLSSVLSECCLQAGNEDNYGAIEAINAAFLKYGIRNGVKKTFNTLIPDELLAQRKELMRVPDWVYLLIKLKSRMSDDSWQTLTNLTKLGRTGVS